MNSNSIINRETFIWHSNCRTNKDTLHPTPNNQSTRLCSMCDRFPIFGFRFSRHLTYKHQHTQKIPKHHIHLVTMKTAVMCVKSWKTCSCTKDYALNVQQKAIEVNKINSMLFFCNRYFFEMFRTKLLAKKMRPLCINVNLNCAHILYHWPPLKHVNKYRKYHISTYIKQMKNQMTKYGEFSWQQRKKVCQNVP